MQINELNQDVLRRLADMHLDRGRVLSVYLDLDPARFATGAARGTEVRSLIDSARRQVKDLDDLTHDERAWLQQDLDQVEEFLQGPSFTAKGAHSVAVFSSRADGFFEALRLPRPVASRVEIDDSPFVEPLADLARSGRWAVLLVNRRNARLLQGSRDHLAEVSDFGDEVRGGVQEGATTGSRSEEAVDEEASDHLRRAAQALFKRSQREPVDRLLIGSPRDLAGAMEEELHPSLRERVAGRLTVDVESSTVDDVFEAARPMIEQDDRRRERDALDALEAGLGTGGRAAAGVEEVLAVLNERRVQTLLYDEGFSAPGVQCRSCGWIGASAASCPVDDGELEERANVVEPAIELTLEQSAEVMVVRHHDTLAQRGSMGAVLRF
jgi:peptide chain release factor subunit 1